VIALDAGAAVLALLLAGAAAALVALLARAQIGGYTGDVLGAARCLSHSIQVEPLLEDGVFAVSGAVFAQKS